MSQHGDIRIENGVITTPNGKIILREDSEARVVFTPRNQHVKKAVGAGLMLAGIFTGGGMWLMAPGIGFLFHDCYEVMVTADGEEFMVVRLKSIIGDAKGDALALKSRITEEIEAVRAGFE